jgi:hypothetical protein
MYISTFTKTHFRYQVQAIQSFTRVKLLLLWLLIENQKTVSLPYDIEETGAQTSTKRPT